MSEKIQPIHTERDAYVYIRQSSMQQVRTRLEGQRRQYDLRERAHASASSASLSSMKTWAAPAPDQSNVLGSDGY